MSSQKHIPSDDVAGLVMLAATDPDRISALDHTRSCATCLHLWSRAEASLRLLPGSGESLSDEVVVANVMKRSLNALLTNMDQQATQRGRQLSLLSWSVGLLLPLAIVLFSKTRSGHFWEWVSGTLLLAVGLWLVGAKRAERRAWLPAVIGPSALLLSMGLGEWTHVDDELGLNAAKGVSCLFFAAFSAVIPVTVFALLTRRSGARRLRTQTVGLAAASSLATVAALLVTCPSHAGEHQLVFHGLGVALACAIGWIAGHGKPVLDPAS